MLYWCMLSCFLFKVDCCSASSLYLLCHIWSKLSLVLALLIELIQSLQAYKLYLMRTVVIYLYYYRWFFEICIYYCYILVISNVHLFILLVIQQKTQTKNRITKICNNSCHYYGVINSSMSNRFWYTHPTWTDMVIQNKHRPHNWILGLIWFISIALLHINISDGSTVKLDILAIHHDVIEKQQQCKEKIK
jgi:hypothetical protein